MAASAAIVAAGIRRAVTSTPDRLGRPGAGNEAGRVLMVSTGSASHVAATVTTTIAMIDPGTHGRTRGASTMMTATTATIARGTRAAAQLVAAMVCTAATSELVLGPAGAPSADGTCCKKMMTAMPSVKPSITGHGITATARPSRSTAAMSTMTPAMIVTSATTPAPCAATMGPSTTTIAPVGPDTWMFEPPNTAATSPATIAVMSPASAPAPELTPNASASGSATMPTVRPAMRSPFHVRRTIA